MLARCARCQGTFTTDRYGRQTCPHCGSELLLADPGAPQPPGSSPEAAPPEATGQGPGAVPPPPPADAAPPSGMGSPPPGAPPPGAPPPGGYPPPPPAGGGWAPLPPPPPAAEVNVPSPFAERKQRGFFGAFFETWKLVCVEPQKFFVRVRIDQLGTAILFGVLAAWVGGAVSAVFGWLSGMSSMALMRQFAQNMPSEGAEVLNQLSAVMGGGFALGQIVLQPVVTLISMFIAAGVIHLFLLMFRGAGRGFEATLTVVAFSYGVQLLQAVPGCGGLIAAVWQAVILIVGLAAAQRCGVGKAVAAVLLPLVLVCCCICAVGAMMATWIGAFLQHLGQGGTANL